MAGMLMKIGSDHPILPEFERLHVAHKAALGILSSDISGLTYASKQKAAREMVAQAMIETDVIVMDIVKRDRNCINKKCELIKEK